MNELVVTIGGAILGGATPVLTLVWRLSGKLSEQQTKLNQLEQQLNEYKAKLAKLDSDLEDHIREQGTRWNELNRTLGKIEGLLIKTQNP